MIISPQKLIEVALPLHAINVAAARREQQTWDDTIKRGVSENAASLSFKVNDWE